LQFFDTKIIEQFDEILRRGTHTSEGGSSIEKQLWDEAKQRANKTSSARELYYVGKPEDKAKTTEITRLQEDKANIMEVVQMPVNKAITLDDSKLQATQDKPITLDDARIPANEEKESDYDEF